MSQSRINPRFVAAAIASVRLITCSLPKMFRTWLLMVVSLTNRSVPISLLLRPRASNFNTSISRAVSPSPLMREASFAASAAGMQVPLPWTVRMQCSNSSSGASFRW